MLAVMLQTLLENLDVVVAPGKCIRLGRELIPKFADKDQLFLNGKFLQFRNLIGNHGM